ncbi:hypothetical protein [Leptolyngbya sp. AN10]|uniref:hypothetical protein n=1 Tax=Leptolyngbya sp. AN10 TaxID=3423365 RepID=UPI003D319FEF
MYPRLKSIKSVALLSVGFGAGAIASAVTLSNLNSVNASSLVAQRSTREPTSSVVEVKGVRIELQGCRRVKPMEVTCNLLVTNIADEDVTFNINRNSRTFDTSGNEYIARTMSIGKSTGDGIAYTQLVTGIPTKGSVSFRLPQQVTKLAVVEIASRFRFMDQSDRFQFRNVDIGGAQASNPSNSNCVCPPQTKPTRAR